ncbi:DNA endonuclease RBBP8-like isoform X1 [Syngnathus typhle]|uniref:DNA endonuclease RBBP8-like isoform X1 n=1 Tax=Syngnathus typhle TaxID=161592 RepID=UPI002A6B39CE|nr:DNA endonuclease RBBP8-like isoform X1 [Syngnathus typhle]
MSSPTSTSKPADPFHGLWIQLRECHQKQLQELEEKVCTLKKERRLDAETLQLFYTNNQELKQQTKSLQNANILLEDRLRAKECDRCAILEENLTNCQEHSKRTVNKLKFERKWLQDENRKLQAELQILKTCSEPQVALSPDYEDGIIPDSPVLASSLPVVNKLKKRKYMDNSKHVHYAEDPEFKFCRSLFKESSDARKTAAKTQVLVPDTCQMETAQILEEEKNDGVVAETCGLELVNTYHMKTITEGKRYNAKLTPLSDLHRQPRRTPSPSTPVHSPDSTVVKSPSRFPRGEKRTELDSRGKEKIQEDYEPKGLTKKQASCQSFKEPPKVQTHDQTADCGSSPFKKPNLKPKEQAHRRQNHLQVQNAPHKHGHPEDAETKHREENMWSIDPALALSMYDSEPAADELKGEQHEELYDSDCTWISHSLLQGGGQKDDNVSGIGDKANDSLERMFDATAREEYISFNSSHLACQPCEEEEDEEEEEPPENFPRGHKVQQPTYAHVAVVRKKDERRKLKGTTCKECEVYYAHLPEEEKVKKLSECSRHRHRFVPPSTPENFWEVGFPSTQTCIERGYIKEEKIPQTRLRRKQPFTALFSPKPAEELDTI